MNTATLHQTTMGLQLLEFIKMYIIYRDARRDPIETRSPRSLSPIDGVESLYTRDNAYIQYFVYLSEAYRAYFLDRLNVSRGRRICDNGAPFNILRNIYVSFVRIYETAL